MNYFPIFFHSFFLSSVTIPFNFRNLSLAFKLGEVELGVPALLEVDDLLLHNPDR